MEERNQLRYVGLSRNQAPLQDIQPGELNQPVKVPQSNPKCGVCGQDLPESFSPPADEPWTTGIFGCAEDRDSCLTGLFCPCVLFGRNVRRLGGDSLLPCICHAIFVEGGMTIALAAAIAFFHGIGPAWTACVIGDSLVYTWMISGICFGQVRRSLQIKYHLKNSPCGCHPCCVHCCLHWCALCQEHREMKGRLADVAMPMTVVNPPPVQQMRSTDDYKENLEATSADRNNGHNALEMQPI